MNIIQVNKKDMHALTSKNYEQLPEIKKKKEEERKKEEMKKRRENVKKLEQVNNIFLLDFLTKNRI